MSLGTKIIVWIIMSGIVIGIGVDDTVWALIIGGICSLVLSIVVLITSYLDGKL